MSPKEIAELEAYLTEDERKELYALIDQDMAEVLWRALPGPQLMAFDSEADIVGYGGAAGGGKTDLIAGLAMTKHKRCLIARREKAQTEGVVQRLQELIGATDGYNSQKGFWRLPVGSEALVEFAGLDNPGDEKRWQGRPHDLKAFDEVTEQREHQVRFVMGWTRTNQADLHAKVLMTFNPPTTSEGRWVIDFFGPWIDKKHKLYPTPPGVLRWCAMLPDGRGGAKDQWVADGRKFVLKDGAPCYEFDPDAHAPEDIIQPKSRTFIPARLTDNPYYMATGYMSTLQSLPEPLRSQMLYGDFQAGISDDVWQVIPTAWVEAAQARWKPRAPRGEMMGLGADVARGGKDNTAIATRHKTEQNSLWFDKPHLHPGTETPDGPTVAGLVVKELRDHAPIMIDVIGVGASPYDTLNGMGVQVLGVNVSEAANGTDKSGRLKFFNLRSMLWWRMREALDPANDTGIALPPDDQLRKELCTPKWSVSGFTVKVESREDIIKRLGSSPDMATAFILALMDVPKLHALRAANAINEVLDYDPVNRAGRPGPGYDNVAGYDPMGYR
jgi:hypothetical protein